MYLQKQQDMIQKHYKSTCVSQIFVAILLETKMPGSVGSVELPSLAPQTSDYDYCDQTVVRFL